MRTLFKTAPWLLTIAILAACTTTGPTGSDGKWQKVGVSVDGNVTHEINLNSIHRQGSIATYQDRKTLKDTKKHLASLPEHKTSLNTWEVNCANKTYRLKATTLYDNRGQIIFSDTFDLNKIRPVKAPQGSSVAKQIEQVCR